MNPLLDLARRGQSVWLDFITRRFVEEGELARLVEADGLRGVTSNPTIFQKAISGGAEYDAAIESLLREGKDVLFVTAGYMVHEVLKVADFRTIDAHH